MTRQPDDPGVDHEREGTRLNQHGDPVMPWDAREPSPLTVAASVAVGGSAFALLIWWLT